MSEENKQEPEKDSQETEIAEMLGKRLLREQRA